MEHHSSIVNNRLSIGNCQWTSGSVLLVVVLLVALLAAVVMGHLQVNTEEIQLMQNHVGGAEALATAEAGLNDALAQLRRDAGWHAGYADKPFGAGSYTVVVDGSTVTSTAVTSRGFVARIQAEIARGTGDSSSLVQVRKLRVNK
jgi:hypothetical protein